MLPGYHVFTRAIALKCVVRPADIPAFTLGVAPYELHSGIEHGRPVLSQPRQINYSDVSVGGVKMGQTYEGTSGFGSLVPMISPGDIPYYGPYTGGE